MVRVRDGGAAVILDAYVGKSATSRADWARSHNGVGGTPLMGAESQEYVKIDIMHGFFNM